MRNYIGIDVIFLDMSGTFNSVSHSYLIEKSKIYGIRGELIDISKDSLKKQWKHEGFWAGVGNRGGRGGILPPGRKNFEYTPPENFEKIYPPPSAARSAAAIFLPKFEN